MNRLEYNKKMLGQSVWIIKGKKSWEGVVEAVLDNDTFLIRDPVKDKTHKVEIYDIRQGEVNFS